MDVVYHTGNTIQQVDQYFFLPNNTNFTFKVGDTSNDQNFDF